MNRKRLLIAGSFHPAALEHQFLRRFVAAGIDVHTFDISAPVLETRGSILKRIIMRAMPSAIHGKINRGLLSRAAELKPDVILVFKGMELYPATIAALRAPGRLLANYNPDHPLDFYSRGAGNQHVRDSVPLFDLHISYAQKIVARLKHEFQFKAVCIPFGYDDDVIPQRSTLPVGDQFVFIGAWDSERTAFLNRLKGPVQIYGPADWSQHLSRQPCRKYYQGRPLYNQDYIGVLHSASGCINLLRQQNKIENSHNMRTFEVCGYGGLLLTERTQEQQEFFEEGKEALFFDSAEELNEQIARLRKMPAEIERLKTNALARSRASNYGYSYRARELLRALELG